MTFEWVMTTLKSAMKQHMIDRDTVSLNVVRGLISALQNKNKELMGKEMTENHVMEVIMREHKQYREALEGAQQSGRQELMVEAQTKISYVERYMPTPMTEEEVITLINDISHEVLATKLKDMPKIMKVLMPQLKGKFDGKRAKELVEESLSDVQIV